MVRLEPLHFSLNISLMLETSCIVNTRFKIGLDFNIIFQLWSIIYMNLQENCSMNQCVETSKLPWKSRVKGLRSVYFSSTFKLSTRQTLKPPWLGTTQQLLSPLHILFVFSTRKAALLPGWSCPPFKAVAVSSLFYSLGKQGTNWSRLFPVSGNHTARRGDTDAALFAEGQWLSLRVGTWQAHIWGPVAAPPVLAQLDGWNPQINEKSKCSSHIGFFQQVNQLKYQLPLLKINRFFLFLHWKEL